MQRDTTVKERTAIFQAWWPRSQPHVDPTMDQIAYLAKWLGDCKRRKRADDENALTAAWEAAQREPLPPEATPTDDLPMTQPMQSLVALCRELQRAQGTAPFYLGSRNAGALIGAPQRNVAYWLSILEAEDGPFRILKRVSTGSQATRRANEYLYLPLLDTRARE